ncbi:MAG: serine hydrolase [Eubacteriales bacterium]|nr:serine hydrolase [Eubacteriales bacterium]
MIFKIKRKLNRLLSAVLAVLLFSCAINISAFALEPWKTECSVQSEGACLMDSDSGVVLFDRNANEKYYPASITKVLTALLVIENCDNLSEVVTFSYDAVSSLEANSTIIGASEGDRLSVLDCLYCLLFQSANEVANALAEHVGAKHPELKEKGMTDQDVFVLMMNKKAEELGCTGTHFNNPSGLTDPNHYTTPYDMCLIMSACIKNETFCDIESRTFWKHAPIRRYPDADDPWNTVYMKHLMLRKNSNRYYKGTIAGKTGYTMTAGNTLVTACRRDGMTLVTCVMNAHANHYNDTIALFDFGFDNFRSISVKDYDLVTESVQADFRINNVPVLDTFTVGLDENAKITVPKGGDYAEVRSELVTENLHDKTALAEMNYYYGDRLVGAAPLRLIPLGGMNEVKKAEEDPMYRKIAGIEDETEALTDGETGENGSEGLEEGKTKEGSEAITTDETGEKADIESDKETGESETPAKKSEKKQGSVLKTIVITAIIILAVLAVAVVLRYIYEKKEAEKRHRRRMRRMKRTEDMTGTQSINMDLEVQRRLKNPRKNNKGRK